MKPFLAFAILAVVLSSVADAKDSAKDTCPVAVITVRPVRSA